MRHEPGSCECVASVPISGRPRVDSFTSTHLSLGRALGLQPYTFRRLLLLLSCILAVLQYGMVLANGVSGEDFNTYYGLSSKQGDMLYSYMNFGACALAFIPGLCHDRLGCTMSMFLGTLIFDAGLIFQTICMAPGASMPGLEFCYLCFGFASSFFNVVGCFAPLKVFPSRHIGKVSACIQVCMSLGITLQSMAYFDLKQAARGSVDRSVQSYLVYALIFSNVTGIFMCLMFRVCYNLFAEEPNSEPACGEARPACSLTATLRTSEFVYFSLLFFLAIGFSFNFLNVESRIAAEVDISGESLATAFGVLNALGRVSVSVPLDYTREHPLGGAFTYLAASLLVFMLGITLLVFPSTPSSGEVYIANALVGFGYGGLLGIIPPALTIFFGSEHLGVIYGILYIGVSVSEPIWGLLFSKAADCTGVECYRTYTTSCVLAFAVMLALTIWMLMRAAKARAST
eukprot:TRINITY_DN17391_c0_g1_i1.p1 TRINITY_DN17391_c0_g1~~TRINITY_DN17391_c0_g1_i1.p1  ORF type:complete len:458 (-),score=48.40 TRINITY_DN17391_c0_g1_i1:216-1589(-)